VTLSIRIQYIATVITPKAIATDGQTMPDEAQGERIKRFGGKIRHRHGKQRSTNRRWAKDGQGLGGIQSASGAKESRRLKLFNSNIKAEFRNAKERE
jgi:hypothetical protein